MKSLFVFLAFLWGVCAQNWVKEMINENPASFVDDPKAERYVEGDMIMTGEELDALTHGYQYGLGVIGKRWNKDRIPYFVESSLTGEPRAMNAIKAAIADYHKYTCLKFVPKTSADKHYFSFYKGSGCSSYVGYLRRVNRISLAPGCWGKGTVMHEMGHSLGLHHEQGRPDRDQHVEILWSNINPKYKYAFYIKQGTEVLTPYDYESMMHYGRGAFGGGKLTIKTKDPSKQYVIGNRSGFSEIDKKQISLMYKCGGTSPTVKPTAKPTVKPTAKPTSGPSGDCKDTDKRCPNWKNYCGNNAYVDKHCKKSCGKCPPCVDKRTDCSKYASRCKDYSKGWTDWMKIQCNKTCKYC